MTKQNINKIPKILTEIHRTEDSSDETVFKKPLLICSLSESEYDLLKKSLGNIGEYLNVSSIEEDYDKIYSRYYNLSTSEPDQLELLSSLHNSGQLKEFLIHHGRILSELYCESSSYSDNYVQIDLIDGPLDWDEDETDLNNKDELIEILEDGGLGWETDLNDFTIDENSLSFSFSIQIPYDVTFLEDLNIPKYSN